MTTIEDLRVRVEVAEGRPPMQPCLLEVLSALAADVLEGPVTEVPEHPVGLP